MEYIVAHQLGTMQQQNQSFQGPEFVTLRAMLVQNTNDIFHDPPPSLRDLLKSDDNERNENYGNDKEYKLLTNEKKQCSKKASKEQ